MAIATTAAVGLTVAAVVYHDPGTCLSCPGDGLVGPIVFVLVVSVAASIVAFSAALTALVGIVGPVMYPVQVGLAILLPPILVGLLASSILQ